MKRISAEQGQCGSIDIDGYSVQLLEFGGRELDGVGTEQKNPTRIERIDDTPHGRTRETPDPPDRGKRSEINDDCIVRRSHRRDQIIEIPHGNRPTFARVDRELRVEILPPEFHYRSRAFRYVDFGSGVLADQIVGDSPAAAEAAAPSNTLEAARCTEASKYYLHWPARQTGC